MDVCCKGIASNLPLSVFLSLFLSQWAHDAYTTSHIRCNGVTLRRRSWTLYKRHVPAGVCLSEYSSTHFRDDFAQVECVSITLQVNSKKKKDNMLTVLTLVMLNKLRRHAHF